MPGRGFRIAEGYLEVTADHSKADREMDGFFRDVDGRLHDQREHFAKEGGRAGEGFAREARKGEEREEGRGFGAFAQRFGARFFRLGGMAGRLFANAFVLKAVAGLAALPAALSLTSALAQGLYQIGVALAALAPAAIGGAIFSLVSLKLAFSGVGAALKAGLAGDMEKFNEALKKLAPSAQQAVRALVALAPAARALKQNVQQDFFAPWVRDIKPLATIYLPILSQRMAAIADFAGSAVHQIAQLFTPPDAAAAFGDMLDGFVLAFGNLTSGLPGLVSGFFNLATAGSAWLAKLSTGFGSLTDRFSAWSADFVDTGRFDAFVSRGLNLLDQLGRALLNVGGIFRSIFAAVPGGGGLFAALGQLTGMLNTFLQSAQGQQVLTQFFARLQTLAGLIMDLVKGALPGLLAVSDGLLKGFQALAPVAGPVGEAIGSALAALAPILPLLGNLLAPVLRLAATLLQVLAAELGPVIALFSDMANQVLPMLLPMLDEFASQVLPVAADAGRQIAAAFAPIVPVWIDMAKVLGGELMKYLPDLVKLSAQMVPIFVQVGKILADTWLKSFQSIQPHLPLLVAMFAAFLKISITLLTLYAGGLPIFVQFFSWFIRAAAWVSGFVLTIAELPTHIRAVIAVVWEWIRGVGAAIGGFFVQIGQWFADLPGKIWGFMQQIPTIVFNALSAAFDAFFYWLGYITATVGQFVLDIPMKFVNMWETVKTIFFNAVSAVGTFLSQLPTIAATFFSQLWNTVTTWVANTYHSVVGWLSGVGPAVGGFFSDAWNRAKTATVNGFNSVVSTIRNLPTTIRNALADAGHWLYDVGADILHGLVNGFNSALGWAKDMINRALEKLKEGAKAALHISSPSRVWAEEVGKPSAQGIGMGFRKAMPDVERVIAARVGALPGMASPNVSVAAPNVTVGGPTVLVLLDGEEVGARVVTPQRVTRANVEGVRRRDFLNTGRTATA